MTDVPVEEQIALLKVADIDAQIARLRRALADHELHGMREGNREQAQNLEKKMHVCARRITEIEEKIRDVELNIAEVEAVIQAKGEKLNAGVGMTSRDLLALQKEIDFDKAKQESIEEEQIGLMLELDDLREESRALTEEHERIEGEFNELDGALKTATAHTEQEISQLLTQRSALYEPLSDVLKKAYENLRAHGSIGVVAMAPDGSVSAGMGLSVVEINDIKKLPRESLYISEELDAIIVRLA